MKLLGMSQVDLEEDSNRRAEVLEDYLQREEGGG